MNVRQVKITAFGVVIGALLIGVGIWQQRRVVLRSLIAENARLLSHPGEAPVPVALLNAKAEHQSLESNREELKAEVALLRAEKNHKPLHSTNSLTALVSATEIEDELPAEERSELAEKRARNELGKIKDRLQLTPDQEETGIAILKKRYEGVKQFTQTLSDGRTVKMTREVGLFGESDEELIPIFTPEQRVEYQKYLEERDALNARVAANQTLAVMQQELNLTGEQPDKLYPILFEYAKKRRFPGLFRSLEIQEQFADVLTPEQNQQYRQSLTNSGMGRHFRGPTMRGSRN